VFVNDNIVCKKGSLLELLNLLVLVHILKLISTKVRVKILIFFFKMTVFFSKQMTDIKNLNYSTTPRKSYPLLSLIWIYFGCEKIIIWVWSRWSINEWYIFSLGRKSLCEICIKAQKSFTNIINQKSHFFYVKQIYVISLRIIVLIQMILEQD